MGTAQANSSRGFTQTCTDVDYEAGVLSATCRTIQGESRRSSIDLSRYIDNPSNCWLISGATPYGSSTQVSQSQLSCDVRTRDGVARKLLSLDEHIENVNGELKLY